MLSPRGNMTRLIALISVAITLAMSFTACSATTGSTSPPNATGPAAGDNFAQAPDFPISAYQGAAQLGGQETTLQKVLAQGKPLVLNLWAGQCPPCRAEMPDFQVMSEQYKDRILVFGLDIGPFVQLGTREDGQALLKELKILYPAGTTFDPEVVRAYGVLGMPTTLLITPDGKIVRKQIGVMLKSQLDPLIQELLLASGKS